MNKIQYVHIREENGRYAVSKRNHIGGNKWNEENIA